ncbi:MAG: acyl carrier protein [Paludibacteraceae bacterium]|nr:acyl carrier protein [Paludibacteraceae bacterium]
MMTDYKEVLIGQLSEELEVSRDKFVDGALLKDDLGFDSLDLVDVVVLIEETVGVKLTQRDFAGVKTFGQMLDLIEHKRQA